MRRCLCCSGKLAGIFLISFFFFGAGIALGQNDNGGRSAPADSVTPGAGNTSRFSKLFGHLETEFTLTAGIRKDELDWSIAGNGVNVLSVLSWSDVESYQITLANRTQFDRGAYFRGAFSYAAIQDGTVRDSDYGGNYLSAEWSRSISETNDDELYDITGAGGYTFHFLKNSLTISPLVGLSYHKQNLRIQNGYQVIAGVDPVSLSSTPPVGPLSSQLNSTYFARWFGPWIGCDLSYIPKLRRPSIHTMELRLSLELHYADYYGEGNWNLRSDLAHPKSFEHKTNGYGIIIDAQWLIAITPQWHVTIAASHQDWTTESGTDIKFLAGGGISTTRLNEVNWQSTSFMVGAGYRF